MREINEWTFASNACKTIQAILADEEIWQELDTARLRTSPVSFIPCSEAADSVRLPSGKPKLIENLFDRGAVQINGHVLKLGSKARAEFAGKLGKLGIYGEVSIPKSDRDQTEFLYQRM